MSTDADAALSVAEPASPATAPASEPTPVHAPPRRGPGRPKGSKSVRVKRLKPKRGWGPKGKHGRPAPATEIRPWVEGLPKTYRKCDCGNATHISMRYCPKCQNVPPWRLATAAAKAAKVNKDLATDARRAQRGGLAVGRNIYKLPEANELIDLASVPHVAMKDIRQQVGDVLVNLKQGQVISSYPLIRALLAGRAPIVPVSGVENLVCCPQCAAIFELPPAMKKALAAA